MRDALIEHEYLKTRDKLSEAKAVLETMRFKRDQAMKRFQLYESFIDLAEANHKKIERTLSELSPTSKRKSWLVWLLDRVLK